MFIAFHLRKSVSHFLAIHPITIAWEKLPTLSLMPHQATNPSWKRVTKVATGLQTIANQLIYHNPFQPITIYNRQPITIRQCTTIFRMHSHGTHGTIKFQEMSRMSVHVCPGCGPQRSLLAMIDSLVSSHCMQVKYMPKCSFSSTGTSSTVI